MAEAIDSAYLARNEATRNRLTAIGVIGAHTIEHIYSRSILVLIPSIYVALGLAPIQVGVLEGVRQATSGLTSMGSGLFVDVLAHRRGQILAFSFGLIGVGYLLVSVAPNYPLVLLALALGSAGAALWHPAALGLLAERFPERKGLVISLHRSTGNVGDAIGPIIVGAVLAFAGWRVIAGGASPFILVVAVVILILLRNVGGQAPEIAGLRANLGTQFASMKDALRGTGMWSVFSVSALRGMGDASLVWVVPLYLSQELGMSNFSVGIHVALMAALGVISGPLFGMLSDRIGRKSIIVFIMGFAVVLPIGMLWGGSGIVMTLSVTVFGLFFFTVNSLTQAAAIDIAEGRRLEGTFIGLMWGSNAFFGAATSIVAGWIVGEFGWPPVFYFAAALFLLGFIASLLMPATGGRAQPAQVRTG